MVPEGLEINVYPGDKAHHKSSKTNPRSELLVRQVILDNTEYSFEFDHYISMYPQDEYGYVFMQIFGDQDPNIALRYLKGEFELGSKGGLFMEVDGNARDNVGKWVNWRIDFLLANISGYVEVYRNNELFLKIHGNTIDGKTNNNSVLKHGFYGEAASSQVQSYTKNVILKTK